MSVVKSKIRSGVYADSIVLMRLQAGLLDLPDVIDAGAVMGTEANVAILKASGLGTEDSSGAGDSDLILVVKAETADAADDALSKVDQLMARRAESIDDFRPRSLRSAVRLMPDAKCVAISVPGKFAAGVARDALELDRHVFLYSDNVTVQEEADLKRKAAFKGLLVMGPDCGTAIIQGVGLGFANRVRQGKIGIVGASGTGIQSVSCSIHAFGAGISHAIGTGGRDLNEEIGAATAAQALNLLGRDPQTEVIVLISKPPAATVAAKLLDQARAIGKPVVVNFLGRPVPSERLGNLYFASTLSQAASTAVRVLNNLTGDPSDESAAGIKSDGVNADGGSYLRGLFAGGTLAQEIVQGVSSFLDPVHSNLHTAASVELKDPSLSEGHTLLDLGDDTYTVGRLHPMIDQDLRLRRLRQEAADSSVGMIVLDVVLGDGANADPAGELAPVIEEILRERVVKVVVLVVGTDEDPQDLAAQVHRLREAGADVVVDPSALLELIEKNFRQTGTTGTSEPTEVSLDLLQSPMGVINVGVEMFFDSISAQGFEAVQVDWRPPAGGNERLASILERMK